MNISSWFTGTPSRHGVTALQSSGDLSRETFLQFAQLCIKQFDSPGLILLSATGRPYVTLYSCRQHCLEGSTSSAEYQQGIREHFKAGKPADEFIEARQAALFEDLGVQGAFGVAQLATIQRRFGNHGDVMQALGLLVQREDAVLNEVELPDSAFAAKQKALQLMQAFQQRMAQFAAGLDERDQGRFAQALSTAMSHAASQVPQQENACMEEGQAAMLEQLRLTTEELRRSGFKVPDAPHSDASSSAGVRDGVVAGSSALTEEEQQHFLARMQRRQ